MQAEANGLPDTRPTRIRAHSQRQAMDWSLVLVSQGIEPILDHSVELGWGLVVAPAEHERALAAIRQFRIENRRWPWRVAVRRARLEFDWTAGAWVFLTCVMYWLNGRTDLRAVGLMDAAAVTRGEWWRLFTATLLHADAAHLASNAVFGLILLGLAMGRYGTGVALLAAYLAGVGGNVAAWLIDPQAHRSLGASGVVMGALGLLAVQSVALVRRRRDAMRLISAGIGGGVMLFVLLGLNPGTDVIAHLGGFACGVGGGFVLTLFPRLNQKRWLNLSAGLVFSALVVWTWWLALHVNR